MKDENNYTHLIMNALRFYSQFDQIIKNYFKHSVVSNRSTSVSTDLLKLKLYFNSEINQVDLLCGKTINFS